MARRVGTREIRSMWGHGLVGILLISISILVAAVIVRRTGGYPQKEEMTPTVVGQFDMVSIPVPTEYVAAGTKASAIRFRNIQFPKHQIPTGALTSLESLQDTVTAAALPANLPLFRENFSRTTAGVNPVLESIPPGMRAMTVRVDATGAVEGWAGSGSIVDILMVEKDRTLVVAEKVKILSAERSVSPVEGAAAPNVPSTVTLLVSQDQCLAIHTAIPRGRIAFALRSTKDDENWLNTVFTAERLKGLPVMAEKRSVITGYVSVKDRTAGRAFALADGKWTKTEAIPEGFLVASQDLVDSTEKGTHYDEASRRSSR